MYYLEFRQPFFQPNTIKNNLEKARISLQQEEVKNLSDLVNIIKTAGSTY